MKSIAPALEYTPIFNWSQPRSRRVSLISFIAASAVLHAFCFYIFQIIYPPTIALLPPPARVNFITPDSEEGRVLLRWIEAEDPALTSTTQRSPEAANLSTPRIEHRPSYFARQPALRKLPPLRVDLSVPSSNPPAPVPLPRQTVSQVSADTATELTFSPEVIPLGKPILPRLDFKGSSKEPPAAAQFRVAISSRGEVSYCFLEDSSGDSRLDEQAARYLRGVRFPAGQNSDAKAENELQWATATFEWGNDIVSPATSAPTTTSP